MSPAASILTTPLPVSKRNGRRVLVCLDRSTHSEACIPYAESLAKTFESEITLMHVMQPPEEQSSVLTSDPIRWEISRLEAQGYLEGFGSSVSRSIGRGVDVRLEQGRPAQRIVQVARELGVDMIVLASSGEGCSAVKSLGGTVQQVLSLTRSSVFIAHRTTDAVAPRRILVPLDGSIRTESVLPTAARLARAHRAELLLVHVVREPEPTAFLQTAEDLTLIAEVTARHEAAAKVYLEHLRQQLAHEISSVRTLVVRHQDENQCLLEISQRERSELVVLSAHGATCDATQSFGSVTAYLLARSQVPMLVLQDLPDRDNKSADGATGSSPPPALRASFAPESP